MGFDYTYTCEKCGGQFYSKVNPSSWKHTICNKCSGKQFKDYPVENVQPSYQPKPVPTTKQTFQPQPKKEFDYEEYIEEMLVVYGTLKSKAELAGYCVPEESLCAWTTSIMIQKGRS